MSIFDLQGTMHRMLPIRSVKCIQHETAAGMMSKAAIFRTAQGGHPSCDRYCSTAHHVIGYRQLAKAWN